MIRIVEWRTKMIFNVENIKCGGCANSIQSKIKEIDGVSDVDVDIENGVVDIKVSNEDESTRELLGKKLHDMGYPEEGTSEGFDAVKTKATSFVSCAVGRMK